MSDLIKILEACKQNDKSAQFELFKTVGPQMLATCRRYINDEDDARDAMQEGFVKVFTNIHKFRGDSNPKTWITRIFINTSIDYYKKKAKNRDMFRPLNVEVDHIDETYEDNAFPCTSDQIVAIMDEMPEGYRAVFNMYCVDGLTHGQIASSLGISEGTSKSQYARAKKYIYTTLVNKGVIHGKAV